VTTDPTRQALRRRPERLGYLPSLDGLRGIAISLVVAQHYFGYPPGGLAGVDLFFVLSGFLITTLLLEEAVERGGVSLGAFYARRARRLLPALFAMLAVYLAVLGVQGRDGLRTVALGGLYFGNVVQAWNLAPVRHSALLQLWSLAEEEQFYVLWPLALLVIWKSRRPLAWASGLVAALLVYKAVLTLSLHPDWMRLYYGPDTHADGLAFGSLLAIVRIRRGGLEVPEWCGKVGIGALGAGAVLAQLSTAWVAFGLPVFEVGVVFLIAAAVSKTDLARWLESRALAGLGRISYSVYLWHAPVWFGMYDVLKLPELPLGALAAPTTILIAIASWRWIEQPFRRHRAVEREPVPVRA